MPRTVEGVFEGRSPDDQHVEIPDSYRVVLRCDVCEKPWHGEGENVRTVEEMARKDGWKIEDGTILCEPHHTQGVRVY